MAEIYILKAVASDLGGGADFSNELSTGTEAAGSITVTVAKAATEDSFGFTPATVPGSNGTSTGTFSVEVSVTTGNTNVFIAAAVARVNSLGTQQAISAFTAEQQATAGVKTFSFSSPALGTWSVGDRLKVVYRFRNAHSMSNQSCVIETGTVDAEVVTPFTAAVPSLSGSGTISQTHSMSATGSAHSSGAGTISQTHSMSATGSAHSSGAGSISQTHSMTATGFQSISKEGTASLSQTSSMTGSGSKGALVLGTISVSQLMAASATKSALVLASLSQNHTTTALGSQGSVGITRKGSLVIARGIIFLVPPLAHRL